MVADTCGLSRAMSSLTYRVVIVLLSFAVVNESIKHSAECTANRTLPVYVMLRSVFFFFQILSESKYALQFRYDVVVSPVSRTTFQLKKKYRLIFSDGIAPRRTVLINDRIASFLPKHNKKKKITDNRSVFRLSIGCTGETVNRDWLYAGITYTIMNYDWWSTCASIRLAKSS